MTLPIVFAIAGCIAILVGLFGGGIKVKEIDIPQISTLPRLFSILIGLALITSATWLSSPTLFQPASTATPQAITNEPPTTTVITPIVDTLTPTIFKDTPTAEVIASSTPLLPTNSPEITSTIPSGLEPGMRVIITASRTTGKAPLNVNFNASDSYLLMDDGKILKCGACSFTWSIRLGAKYIYGPEKKDATFSFTFAKKGSYFVILQVCRNAENEACGTAGIYIVAN